MIFRHFERHLSKITNMQLVSFSYFIVFTKYFYSSGQVITAAYVPLPNYHALFTEAQRANQLLIPSTQALHGFSGGMQGMLNGMPPAIR